MAHRGTTHCYRDAYVHEPKVVASTVCVTVPFLTTQFGIAAGSGTDPIREAPVPTYELIRINDHLACKVAVPFFAPPGGDGAELPDASTTITN